MTHTKGKLRVVKNYIPYGNGAQSHTECLIFTELDHPQIGGGFPVVGVAKSCGLDGQSTIRTLWLSEEDARRLVACWNACEGVSTENLEFNDSVKVLAENYNAIKTQRDELLEALKAIIDCISETRGKNADQALEKAREAINKAEGKE